MPRSTTWSGSPGAMHEFLAAIARNCTCQRSADGTATGACSAHALALSAQLAINRLVFAHHIAKRLRQEEGLDDPSPPGC